jgi:hypothetical protein
MKSGPRYLLFGCSLLLFMLATRQKKIVGRGMFWLMVVVGCFWILFGAFEIFS